MLKYKVDVCALLETRVKVANFQKFSKNIFKYWKILNNYHCAYNGRIWLAWNPNFFDVTVLSDCEQGIFTKITKVGSDLTIILLAVYAYNTQELRKKLWEFISSICSLYSDPMIVCGDFNSVLLATDRLNGGAVTEAEIKDFDQCIQSNCLYQVPTVGADFTWCNNQEGQDIIIYRIDRCLANQSWLSSFPRIKGEILEKRISLITMQFL